jgi:hypothetical protein
MSLKRKVATRPGPSRPRAVVATPRVPASAGQRRKVAGLGCLVCGRSPVDPAHVVPRRPGGCDSAEIGVDTSTLFLSQPDHGEQALEILDLLVRSGEVALVVIDSVAPSRRDL